LSRLLYNYRDNIQTAKNKYFDKNKLFFEAKRKWTKM